MKPLLKILFEHPQWQLPLFSALKRQGVPFTACDLKSAVLDPASEFPCTLVFNQASPSAYLRGNTGCVPMALAWMQSLELQGIRVLNGSRAFLLELSKSMQLTLMQTLRIPCPRSLLFHNVEAALQQWNMWPALLKPQQGGSGARIFKVGSAAEVREILCGSSEIWHPDHLYLLQELVDYDRDFGVVRMEFVGQKLLYAMRIVSHGAFNLCPSETCHPVDGGESLCEIPLAPKVEFYAYKDLDRQVLQQGELLARTAGLDVCGIEFLYDRMGRAVFYDVNANSNLRPAVAQEFGFDPFERVAEYLALELAASVAGHSD